MRNALLALFCCFTTAARADDDGERAALARLIHELDALAPLIAEAETQANPESRVRFHYGWLRQDIEHVKLGIREHIEAPRTTPREFPPLKGDYRR
ncbi:MULTISPECIES: RAQPRD family integrative conjugative element protein [unclassified Methylocaldum]|jgi:RAQPRD family integrative conjugative element protein|uniref:integrative conjugative element protein, RAQPRD family n=1 Tax=unclassified Methylocaldum TaxID=2622260 RepID=UPI000A329954|nr:RAQPRD family integrative conjugative element protein [Methylocaldum sp. RMAD-M]MBP1152279.1 RAQPRD family integrative conjugative element protein [Methylocaldum sp. RMAD-M]